MSDVSARWIPGLDPSTGALALPLWAAGALAALFVVFCALALARAGRDGAVGSVARIALVVVGAMVAWFFLEGSTGKYVASERHALEARVNALATRATTPGSPLACLDAMAGDTVESACERTLFATPETTASAVSYIATQISLLTDISVFVKRGNPEMAPLLANLRRAIEIDRYGIVAHVLATRDGCTAALCPALTFMRDSSRVTSNLTQGTYDQYVARYAAAWPAPGAPPAGGAPTAALPGMSGQPALASGASSLVAPGAAPGTARPELFFPSSESIPPVNIMTAEPAGQPESTGSTPPARTPPRRPSTAPKQAQPKQAPIDLNAAGAPPAQ
jgi:hypothetical protein